MGTYKYERFCERLLNELFLKDKRQTLACKSIGHQSVAETFRGDNRKRPRGTNHAPMRIGCSLSESDDPPDTSDNATSFTERVFYEDWNCFQGNTKNTLECMGRGTSFLNG